MSEVPETIGSMPSVPQKKPQPQKSGPNNFGAGIGLLICVLCLVIFPKYANTNDLITGFFYGIGLIMMLLAIIQIRSSVSRNRASKLSETTQTARPRKRWELYISRLFFASIIIIIYLLTFPTVTGLLWLIGFALLLLVPVISYNVLSRYTKKRKPADGTATKSKNPEQQPKQRANGTNLSIGFLLLSLYFLALPKIINLSDLFTGFFYGIGLSILLMAIIELYSAISKRLKRTTSRP